MAKEWVLAPQTETDVVTQLLKNRGVVGDAVQHFLHPDWERDTFAPAAFTKMDEAVRKVFDALERGEKIIIHGDYDADGVCGSSVLFITIEEIGRVTPGLREANVQAFLPDRERDGYGVAMHTIERIAAEGTKLVITVDCGIANGLEFDRAHELGLTAVVCDHHQLGTHLPSHATLLHPLAPGETYPNKMLCGTGVAFKFASALYEEARRRGADLPVGHERWLLDLVAIATVTDVMPLLGENRVLETYGLKVLRKTRRPGLKAIIESAGIAIDETGTEEIGFRIGPRLNAAGRMVSAEFAFKTLVAKTSEEALVTAAELERLNKERQKVFAVAYAEAKAMIIDVAENFSVLVVAKNDWLPGIVGLIAGKLVNEFGRPAFALTQVGEHMVGSGRSLGGLHLVEAMNSCSDIFVKKGGHPQACGLTLKSTELVSTFREQMNSFAQKHFGETGPQDTLNIDAPLSLSDISWELFEQLQACEPFGEGNREPLFIAEGVNVIGAETMGTTGSHMRLMGIQNGVTQKFVGFGFGSWVRELMLGGVVDIVFTIGLNVWNGRRELQLRIVDIRKV